MRKLFIIYILFCCAFCSSAGEVWKGEGDVSSPYLIQSNVDLMQLAQKVNDGNDYDGAYFRLESDLDLSTICGELLGDWPSIGSIDAYFEGNFDGNGHLVSHLYIQERGTTYKGLFGYVGAHGKISNLTVEGSVYASFWAGAVAGASSGTITNCVNQGGSIEAYQIAGGIVGGNFGVVSKCQNKATIQSSLSTGGLCGYNYGSLYDSNNLGEIYGYNGAGGLTGYNGGFSSFTNCYNVPIGIVQNCANVAFVSGRNKVGGIAGRNDGLIFNDYNFGELSANMMAGGLVGCNGGFDGVDGFVYNSYNTGDISCSVSQAGGVVGINNSVGDVINVYNSGKVFVPTLGGALLGVNEGNLSQCYWVGDTCDLVAADDGFVSNCKVFSKDSLSLLTNYLNQWVNSSKDLAFSHWKCLSDSCLPFFSDVTALFHNVIAYNFHGVLGENLLAFPEGEEVSLTITPDSGYVLSEVKAICGVDFVSVTVEENRLTFVMPDGDVSLLFQWQSIADMDSLSFSRNIMGASNLKVAGGKGELSLWADENVEVQVYSINGQMIRRIYMVAGEQKSIKISSGVYIVNGHETLIW